MVKPLALATCDARPRSCADDVHLMAALEVAGIAHETVPWTAKANWSGFRGVLIRATWDYYEQPAEFRAWFDRLDALGVPVWNPTRVLRWNLDKRYLGELATRGVTVVPTRYLQPGENLARAMDDAGWSDAVVKPAVSAGAWSTLRVARSQAKEAQAHVDALARLGAVLAQPFLREITQGEWSLLFFGGAFSHAVRKLPAQGDFRVQEKHGGTLAAAQPTPAMVAQAGRVLEAAEALTGEGLLYARVDGVMLGDEFTLMELEVMEPELFFRTREGSAARLVRVLQERLR